MASHQSFRGPTQICGQFGTPARMTILDFYKEMVEKDFIGLRDVRALRRVSYSTRSFEILIARCVTIELTVSWINFHGKAAMFARIVRPKKEIVGSHGERQDTKDLID